MLFGTWSEAHAYDPSDYMETRLKVIIYTFEIQCNKMTPFKTQGKLNFMIYLQKELIFNYRSFQHHSLYTR